MACRNEQKIIYFLKIIFNCFVFFLFQVILKPGVEDGLDALTGVPIKFLELTFTPTDAASPVTIDQIEVMVCAKPGE